MKRYLMTPGPTPVPERVLLEMGLPLIHHRSPEFEQLLQEVREGLKYLFQTGKEVIILASSGTGAMEGVVSNTLSRGDVALVVNGGKFGERWAEICQAYGVETDVIHVPWGKAVEPAEIEERLHKNPSIKAILVQASETSTGVKHPVEKIAQLLKNRDETIIIVDAITALGVFDIPMDKWGLDVVVTGSQKALMLPPGLAFAALSDKAWRFAERSNLPKYYFDFKKELKNLKKNQNAYTPAVSLIIGLREALRMIKEEGLERVFQRNKLLAEATRKAFLAMGMELYAPKSPSDAVTAIKLPEGIDGEKLVLLLSEKYGITIAGGQDAAKGKIFRVAHMGYIEKFDQITAIAAVEMALYDMGYPVELGKGVRAAEEVLRHAENIG